MRARISSGEVGDVEAEHGHAALVRLDEAEQRLDERALAGAVGAEQADRARQKVGGDVLERPVLAVANADAIALDDGTWSRAARESRQGRWTERMRDGQLAARSAPACFREYTEPRRADAFGSG